MRRRVMRMKRRKKRMRKRRKTMRRRMRRKMTTRRRMTKMVMMLMLMAPKCSFLITLQSVRLDMNYIYNFGKTGSTSFNF